MTLIDELRLIERDNNPNRAKEIVQKISEFELVENEYQFFFNEIYYFLIDPHFCGRNFALEINSEILRNNKKNICIDYVYYVILSEYSPDEFTEDEIKKSIDVYKIPPFKFLLANYSYNRKNLPEALSIMMNLYSSIPTNTYGNGNLLNSRRDFTFFIRIGKSRIIYEEYMKYLISVGNISEAKESHDKYYSILEPHVLDYRETINDMRFEDLKKTYENLEQKAKQLDDDFKKERSNYIQILGIFSGIVAFVAATISIIAKVDDLNKMIFLISLMTISLIAMLLTVNILFGEEKNKNLKIGILIFLITLLFFFFLISYLGISNLVKILHLF